jgi:predicted metal-dependent HD superfamily phosphohydrolase
MILDFQLRAHVWAELLPRYSEPHRHYHNVQHIEECLREFEFGQHLAADPAAVELAILFHDAIYDPRRSDNEEQSAQLAIALLTEMSHLQPWNRSGA